MSKDTISKITDKVIEEMTAWRNRPPDRRVYPVLFIDAIVVKVRDGQVTNRFLAFLKQIQARFPTGKLYIVCDNFSPHKEDPGRRLVRRQRRQAGVHPTNASWLNWIESEFTALRYFTLDGSNHPSHTAQEHAIAGYVRWRNQRAKPKRHFAIDSKIRRPDYLPNVA